MSIINSSTSTVRWRVGVCGTEAAAQLTSHFTQHVEVLPPPVRWTEAAPGWNQCSDKSWTSVDGCKSDAHKQEEEVKFSPRVPPARRRQLEVCVHAYWKYHRLLPPRTRGK